MTLLAVRGLTRTFGGLTAVDCVDLDVGERGVHALIGPNGAGKTTLVSLICGRLLPTSGSIHLEGRDITRLPAHARVALGVAYTFQITSIYPRLSALENVAIAAMRTGDAPDAAASAMLERVGLADESARPAGTLSYGHQRLLEIGMGLALRPRLLILDEPTQGLAAAEIAAFKSLAREISLDASVMLIEHNMDVVMDLADRVTVLDMGRVIADDAPATIRADPAVRAVYLGA